MQKPQSIDARATRTTLSQVNLILAASFAVGFVVAEASSIWFGIVPSVLAHALIIPAALMLYGLDRADPFRRLLPVIALFSLLRLLSVTLPVKQVLPVYWAGMVSVPLLLAAALLARRLDLVPNSLGLKNPFSRDRRAEQALPQMGIVLTGIPVGLVGYWLYQPAHVLPKPVPMLLLVVVLVVFAAFVEEFVARGIAQRAVIEALGRGGTILATLVFSMLYLGTMSPLYIGFVFAAGLFWGWCRERNRGLWGVMGAHAIANVLMLVVLPLVWRG
jgi:membrane protease YdiL (CAAX protease family)